MKNDKLVKIGLGIGTTILVAGAVLYRVMSGEETSYIEVDREPDKGFASSSVQDYIDVDIIED